MANPWDKISEGVSKWFQGKNPDIKGHGVQGERGKESAQGRMADVVDKSMGRSDLHEESTLSPMVEKMGKRIPEIDEALKKGEYERVSDKVIRRPASSMPPAGEGGGESGPTE